MSYTIKELKGLATKNPELLKFIDEAVERTAKDCREVAVYKNYGWKWDLEIEMYDESRPYTNECFAMCNEDMIDEEEGESGWELLPLDVDFINYMGGYDWDKITLDNGDVVFFLDEELMTYFQVFSRDNLIDGKIDGMCGFGPHSLQAQN